jgi:hypothetical protein
VATAIALLSFLLEGCARNSVSEISDESYNLSETLIVVGIAAPPTAPNNVAILEQVDPATGKGGDCYRWNRAEVASAPATGEVMYHVFKVPPGAYARGWNTQPLLAGNTGNAFVVPGGTISYIGDFLLLPGQPKVAVLNGSNFAFQRDIAQARAKLPKLARELRLAEIIAVPSVPRAFVCTP